VGWNIVWLKTSWMREWSAKSREQSAASSEQQAVSSVFKAGER